MHLVANEGFPGQLLHEIDPRLGVDDLPMRIGRVGRLEIVGQRQHESAGTPVSVTLPVFAFTPVNGVLVCPWADTCDGTENAAISVTATRAATARATKLLCQFQAWSVGKVLRLDHVVLQ